MKKKSSIIKLSVIGVLIIIGLVLSFCTFDVGFSTYNSFFSSVSLGPQLDGGVYAIYEVDASASLEDTQKGFYKLLTEKGYTGTVVTRLGQDKLKVEALELDPDNNTTATMLESMGAPVGIKVTLQSDSTLVADSTHITNAYATYYNNQYVVVLMLNADAARTYNSVTRDNVGGTIDISTITYDDESGEEVSTSIYSSTIEGQINNGAIIIGNQESSTAASHLANQIMSGTIGSRFSFVESASMTPLAGENALKWSLIAYAIGLALALALIAYRYRMFGVVALINLAICAILMLFFLSVFPWMYMSVAGIIGVFISTILVLGSNVIVFERIKEEYFGGKSIQASTHYGFKKSLRVVLDSAAVVVLIAAVSLIFPTAYINAMGFSLIAGAVLMVVGSLFFTRKLIKYFLNINEKNGNIYALVRSSEHAGLAADQTASYVQAQIDAEIKEKQIAAQEKENSKPLDKGGMPDEE